jgi:hypothetical protein
MKGVTIPACGFDLRDLLAVLGESARRSAWTIEFLECLGDGAEALHRASDEGRVVGGEELLEAASRLSQTIDGTFSARCSGAAAPWVVIDVIDGTWFDVQCDDAAVLAAIRARFADVRERPEL